MSTNGSIVKPSVTSYKQRRKQIRRTILGMNSGRVLRMRFTELKTSTSSWRLIVSIMFIMAQKIPLRSAPFLQSKSNLNFTYNIAHLINAALSRIIAHARDIAHGNQTISKKHGLHLFKSSFSNPICWYVIMENNLAQVSQVSHVPQVSHVTHVAVFRWIRN